MAITDIQATVLANTGKTPTANSIEDAQKFVVSTIPKDLLKWTASLTDPDSHGGNESQGVNIVMPTATDSILRIYSKFFKFTFSNKHISKILS